MMQPGKGGIVSKNGNKAITPAGRSKTIATLSRANILGIGLVTFILAVPTMTTAEWDTVTEALTTRHKRLAVTLLPSDGLSETVVQQSPARLPSVAVNTARTGVEQQLIRVKTVEPAARDEHRRLFKKGLGGISTYGEGGL